MSHLFPVGNHILHRAEMRKVGIRTWSLGLALAIVLSVGYAGANQDPGACVTCHQFLGGELARPVNEWKNSIHQQNDITCDLCHGGNADVTLGNLENLSDSEFEEKQAGAMWNSSDFIGSPSGKDMFSMCSQCHDDSVARYASSIMGRAYLADKGGPSCVLCHNAHHNTMPPVPESCAACHKDTSGFDQIDPMNVTVATINKLSQIRIKLAEKKAEGERPHLAPDLPEELDSYQIGLTAFVAVLFLLFIGSLIYVILERRK